MDHPQETLGGDFPASQDGSDGSRNSQTGGWTLGKAAKDAQN